MTIASVIVFVDHPAEAVLRMGRPTILVPEHVHDLRVNRIVVGWKDAREARLAVSGTHCRF